jgi:hypothetical protein
VRKIYLDVTQSSMCLSVYVKEAEIILAGTSINSMSIKERDRNREYQRFADEYDIHFIFDDNVPEVDFYTIPMVDIFATDNLGGYISTLGHQTDIEENFPICYIDKNRNCYLIADNGKDFLDNVQNWKSIMKSYTDIEFFASLAEANEKYEFLDRQAIEQQLNDVSRETILS